MEKHDVFVFCAREMRNSPRLYVDKSCNQVNLTTLAESFLSDHPEISEEEESVFEAVSDWFDQWLGRIHYNN